MKIRVFGDWHGNTEFAVNQLKEAAKDKTIDAYVHVGDFGIWPDMMNKTFRKAFVNSVERQLSLQDRELLFLDGNHEDFRILEDLPKDSLGRGIVSEHINHLPRGFSWDWDGVKFAALGGAVSVDRNFRELGVSYFEEEEITERDVEVAKALGKVDILFTHEAPRLPVPKKSFGGDIDEAAARSVSRIAEVAAFLEPKLLIHGHYHLAYEDQFLGTRVIGLSCDGPFPSRNFIDVDTTALNGG